MFSFLHASLIIVSIIYLRQKPAPKNLHKKRKIVVKEGLTYAQYCLHYAINIHVYREGVLVAMAIVVRNGCGDSSSNPGRGYLHITYH